MSNLQSIPDTVSHKRFADNSQCDLSLYHNCDMQRIGEKIKALREAKSPLQSQEDLAKRAGVSQTTIADLERGRNETSRRLTNIASELMVTAEELVSLDSEKLISLASDRQNKRPKESHIDRSAGSFLSRKSSPAISTHNTGVTKALIDLAKELERGELPPEVHAMLLSEIENKRRVVRDLLSNYDKTKKK